MLHEVSAAVLFIASILKRSQKVSNDVICKFINQLFDDLQARFQDHWFEEFPERGSAYRCIRNTRKGLDPRICKAGSACGIAKRELTEILPTEFILWIDPLEVSYRVGEYGCLTKLSREEMTKAHNTLKGGSNSCFTPRTASPIKRTARASPITIRSIDGLQSSGSMEDCRLLKTPSKGSSSNVSQEHEQELISNDKLGEFDDQKSECSRSLPDEGSNSSSSCSSSTNSGTSSLSSPLDNILDFVDKDSLSQTTSIFERSMSFFDMAERDHLLQQNSNDFNDHPYRFSADAMNANGMHWNMNQLSLLAGNFWQQNQSSAAAAAAGFNDYLASQAFNNTSNVGSAIYALNWVAHYQVVVEATHVCV